MIEKIKRAVLDIWIQFKNGAGPVMGASLLNKATGLLINLVLVRLFSQAEYGRWSYVSNAYSYLLIATGFGMLNGALQFGVENRGRRSEYDYYHYCLKYGFIINGLLVLGFIFFSFFYRFAFPGIEILARTYAPVLLLDYFVQIFLVVLRCKNRIKEYVAILNIHTILLTIGTCVGAVWGIMGIIAGRYLSYVIIIILIIFRMKPEMTQVFKSGQIDRFQSRELWHYSVFMGLSGILNQLLFMIDISMVANLLKDAVAEANYKTATLIPNALLLIPNSIMIAILPSIIAHNKDYQWLKSHIRKLMGIMLGLNFIICLGLFVLAPQIIGVLFGNDYSQAVPIMRVLIIDYLIGGTFRSISVNVLGALKYVNYNLFVSVMAVLCDILFNYLLINRYGITGAAYATLWVMIVASGLAFCSLLFAIVRIKRQEKTAA